MAGTIDDLFSEFIGNLDPADRPEAQVERSALAAAGNAITADKEALRAAAQPGRDGVPVAAVSASPPPPGPGAGSPSVLPLLQRASKQAAGGGGGDLAGHRRR